MDTDPARLDVLRVGIFRRKKKGSKELSIMLPRPTTEQIQLHVYSPRLLETIFICGVDSLRW